MTNAELAILGLIVERPRHGYEIEQVIEERGMRDWTEVAFSSIYYILRKLEGEGLVQGRMESGQGRGPARKVYQITTAGFSSWSAATIKALSEAGPGSDPFLLGMAGIPAISPEEVSAALGRYLADLGRRRDQVHARWKAAGPHLPLFLEGMFDFSISMIEARMEWVEAFISRMEGQETNSKPAHK